MNLEEDFNNLLKPSLKNDTRELHEQMKLCSCPMLLLVCVIYWHAKEICRIVRDRELEDEPVDIGMPEHISPIEWDNVILYWQYILDRGLIR
jgi:hypothetical protein